LVFVNASCFTFEAFGGSFRGISTYGARLAIKAVDSIGSSIAEVTIGGSEGRGDASITTVLSVGEVEEGDEEEKGNKDRFHELGALGKESLFR